MCQEAPPSKRRRRLPTDTCTSYHIISYRKNDKKSKKWQKLTKKEKKTKKKHKMAKKAKKGINYL